MTEIAHTPVNFILDNVGSRSVIRLLNSACGWAKAIAGKTHFTFLGCLLDTEAVSKNWLKPLDNEIYVIKGIKGLLTFKDKCYDRVNKAKIETLFRAAQHATKTVADSAAGLRCLGAFGLVALAPYKKGLGLTKNSFAVLAGGMEIVCRVHDLWLVTNDEKATTPKEQKALNARWMQDVFMVIVQIFSIQLNFFGGLDTMFGETMRPEDRMPDVVFNFWGTCASFASLGYASASYFAPGKE